MSTLTYGHITFKDRLFEGKCYKVSENYVSYFIQNMECLS